MSLKLSTRQVDGITILDLSGRITLGEGSVQLRDATRDLLSKGRQAYPVEPRRRQLHRQLGYRRVGQRLHHRQKPGRRTEAPEPHQKGPRPASDHQALHRLRREGRRSLRHRLVRQVRAARQTFTHRGCHLRQPLCLSANRASPQIPIASPRAYGGIDPTENSSPPNTRR